jgi:BASS family bile acid:Na+ symporter
MQIHLNVGETVINVFLITLLPAFIGTRIRKWKPLLADGLERPLKFILPLLLGGIYAGVIFIDDGTESATMADFIHIFPYAFLLNLLSMLAALAIAKLMSLRLRDQFTIAIEVGLQNSALAIFISVTLLRSHTMSLVPLVYGSFTFFSALLFGWLVKKISRKQAT